MHTGLSAHDEAILKQYYSNNTYKASKFALFFKGKCLASAGAQRTFTTNIILGDIGWSMSFMIWNTYSNKYVMITYTYSVWGKYNVTSLN